MNPVLKVSAIAALALSVTGCVVIDRDYVDRGDWEDEQRENRLAISQLELGMDREGVLDRLGSPSFTEAYEDDGEEVRVLFYRTQRKHSDGETTRDETTPLVFRNNELTGWGDAAYRDARP